jgi:hypothetical protein
MVHSALHVVRLRDRSLVLALVLAPSSLGAAACDRTKAGQEDPPPPSAPAPPPRTPPAAFSAAPVSLFADAGAVDGKSAYDQAREYEASGQLWMARLVLENKALGPDATKDETELLAKVCVEQGDEACVTRCGAKLGHKIKFDAGPPAAADAGRVHQEPDTDVAHARDLLLKGQLEDARKALEPRVLDGKASKDEIRMLRIICERQGDRMCVALCDAKLR